MATLVCFHAHPDDESIATGGTMALAADAGHEVVLVLGTRGEQGEPQPGVLAEGEALWERRVAETHEAARLLGVSRVEFLGYEDSGMMGEATNENPACFWRADLDQASDRLALLLREVGADVLTVYDDHGGYGHPDHIQVHRVGLLAAEKAGVPAVFESTMNRDHIRRAMAARAGEFEVELEEAAEGVDTTELPEAEQERMRRAVEETFGSPEDLITHGVDVSAVLDRKRAAMQAHASQIGPDSFFLTMDDDAFAGAFGTEWFIAHGVRRLPGDPFVASLFDGS
ncbi:PIG-L family deacetylase [Rhabdothermincola salaria]|uniref:PIG-L family deacetylase n=1 Tax=Rhabdothermincola salaria TaxID=2903142 RepID=UPI001E3C71DF|nr:PIG-L family deacetylase [Rhabdothermincola salaria]MCD9624981.1 PIG-L family deacetylase [Rhabdothermincola salaria]